MNQSILKLNLFGTISATLEGRKVQINSGPARCVLGYLSLSPGMSEPRGRLAATVWENLSEVRARQNLRQAVHALGRTFASSWNGLDASRSLIAISPHHVVTDMQEVLQAVHQGQVSEGLQNQLPDRLLADEVNHGTMFDAWLRLRKQEYEGRLREGLERIMMTGQPEMAQRAAQILLAIDPSDEAAARYLICAYHNAGRTGKGLLVYEKLWNHLGEEYDTEPAPETLTLIAALKSETPIANTRQVSPPGKLRIGLAEVTANGDALTQSTAKLFRAELMSTLSRFRAFELVDLEVANGAADYVLDASVRASDTQLSLFVTLKQCSDGVVAWSESWSGLLDNWLKVQASVIARLTSSLSLTVSRARLDSVRKTKQTAGAIDDWLLGNMYLDQFCAEGLRKASECFERVIVKAPELSLGFSSLSRLKNGIHLMQPGMIRTNADHQSSKELASRAVSIDPLDSRAHLHRGWACCLLGEYDQSSVSFAMARSCNENDPWTVLSSALGAAYSGEMELAQSLSQRTLDEGWTTAAFQWGFHTPIRFLLGDFEGCIMAANNAQGAIINIPAWKAAALWHLNRQEEAETAWTQFEKLATSSWIEGERPSAQKAFDWLVSCFPIRNADQQRIFASGVAGAAGNQVHWEQQYEAMYGLKNVSSGF